MKIIIVRGDILDSMSDAIVLAANSRLAPSSGECGAIFNAAGYDKLKNALKKYSYCKPGEAVITDGFDLKNKYIIHAVAPIFKNDKDDDLLLSKCYINSLNLAVLNNCITISFPALSTGLYNYPYDLAASIAIEAINEFKKLHDNDLAIVYIYCFDDEIYKAYKDALYKYNNDWKRNISNVLMLEESLKNRNKRVSIFKDTRELYLNNKKIAKAIKYTKNNTIVYKEDFKSLKDDVKEDNKIILERLTTINASKKYLNNGKLGILNFASGTHPGGGVLTGSNAQEESICRLSTLYISLNDEKGILYDEFYGYNKEIGFINSDRIIYSPNILIFKNDDSDNTLLNEKEWYYLDVITSAAIDLSNNNLIDKEVYDLMYKRIKNILEVAKDNELDTLILGAFGCGVFNNNPIVIAKIFKELLNDYLKHFKNIVFAIPDNDKEKSFNYKAFEMIFN